MKQGLALSNRPCADGTHDSEVSELRIEDRMVNDPRDSRRKDKLNTGRHILIDIYRGENEMRGESIVSSSMGESKKRARGSVMEL